MPDQGAACSVIITYITHPPRSHTHTRNINEMKKSEKCENTAQQPNIFHTHSAPRVQIPHRIRLEHTPTEQNHTVFVSIIRRLLAMAMMRKAASSFNQCDGDIHAWCFPRIAYPTKSQHTSHTCTGPATHRGAVASTQPFILASVR